ncbi:MAG TPA: 2-isopropylmalate synthase [Solirubrobacterales bacterium]|nr:2-isopropylmalate synthase [Solirubrobacterales bacterium]
MSESRRITIFDTTLRDGEQSPGASMNIPEKLEIAQALVALGVDVIEAGFPIASQGDFEAVRQIAQTVRGSTICGLARCNDQDIDRAWEALKHAERARIHVFLATSAIHREFKLKMGKEEIIQRAVAGVKRAAGYCDDIEFSPEDAARTEPDFLCEVVEAAINAGATTVNIPDTVGYATPAHMGNVIRTLRERVPNIDRAVISIHCHNDLGLAVANSLSAVENGAGQIECTINGIGERAGNCSLEEVVMALRTRQDYYGCTTGIATERLVPTSRLVSNITGIQVQRNKAIVGRNAFAHESGIHQDGVLKERSTYEIMDATEVGFESNSIVLGKHSGRHALKDALEQLGYKVDGGALNSAFKAFKEVADRKKQVTALDLEAIVSDEMRDRADAHELASFEVTASSEREPLAKIGVTLPSGETVVGESTGDGPIDAVFRAIKKATGVESELAKYTVEAVSGGDDALGEVTCQLRTDGTLASGSGVATDIIEASARAYLRALSNSLEGAATREAEAATAEAAVERTPGP